MSSARIIAWSLCAMLLAGQSVAAPLRVVYPRVASNGEDAFGFRVLKLALDESGVDYRLSLTGSMMNHQRAREMLRTGLISVFDFGTSPAFEQEFTPIYFPIDEGLNGWRLFIIKKSRQPDFNKVRNLADLRRLTAGQGPWSDSKVLEASGIRVVTARFSSLFKMVAVGRFDFFPLGVNEVYSLFDDYGPTAPGLTVEKHIVIIYPFGRLFFVRKGNQRLHDIIQKGLEKAWADGAFQRLFNNDASYRMALRKANLRERVHIRIPNPFLTERFRQIPKKYFFRESTAAGD